MTENKRFTVETFIDDYLCGFKDLEGNECEIRCDGKHMTYREVTDLLNNFYEENIVLKKKLEFLNELNKPYGELIGEIQRLKKELDRLHKENEQLKQRCKELRNDLIDHSALINMLEKVKALKIEDMIWNTMGYKTQTEFDDDFADYREYAKKGGEND